MMKEDLKEILYSEEKIRRRVKSLGEQITSDYKDKSPIVLGILKGSFIFMADLIRRIELKCEVRFLSASSYNLGAVSTGNVSFGKTLDFEIGGRDVIIIEDILDTGVTLSALRGFLTGFNPSSVKICALLDKPARRKVPVSAEYVGFTCPDEFIVGYGLDYAERYRNLPFIASLKPEIYS